MLPSTKPCLRPPAAAVLSRAASPTASNHSVEALWFRTCAAWSGINTRKSGTSRNHNASSNKPGNFYANPTHVYTSEMSTSLSLDSSLAGLANATAPSTASERSLWNGCCTVWTLEITSNSPPSSAIHVPPGLSSNLHFVQNELVRACQGQHQESWKNASTK